MKTYCVIPAYNEEKNIAKVLKEVSREVDHVVVVDDCSKDKTESIIKNCQLKNLSYLKHIINRGQGASLQTGNDYAIKNKADIIIHFDADGQFLAKEIKEIIKPIKEKKADIVFGSRFLNKKSDIPFLKEKFILPLARIVNKTLIGKTLSDPQSGFRAMNKKAFSEIKIKNDRMAHCTEIIQKALSSDLRVKEVPITVIYKDFGQKFSGGIRIIKDLLISRLIN
jgi:glycosyltransferase involved in cell wall biosynthesis